MPGCAAHLMIYDIERGHHVCMFCNLEETS